MTYESFFGRVTFPPPAADDVAPPELAAVELAAPAPDDAADTVAAADDDAETEADDPEDADEVATGGALPAALDVLELPPEAALVLQADTATSAAVPIAPQNASLLLCITTPLW
jgi:hypothetical protein